MGRAIIVANQKGGVGKTTTVVNLSAYMAEDGKRTLVVDLDSQGNSCSGLGVKKNGEQKGLYEALVGLVDVEEIIYPTAVDNLFIIPSNINLSGAQVELVSMTEREFRLKKVIDRVKDSYDFILIDAPPSLGLLTINGLVASDSVIIPIQCEYYALEGLSQLLKTINLVRKRLNAALQLEGVLLTMYDTRTNLSKQVMEEIIAYFKNRVYKTVIPRNVKLAEAPSYGKPISSYDPKSIGALSYYNLSKEIVENGEKGTG
ncbi:MAG TPA: AAA family ATPase [Spirochaetota bacterium]|nr:AAA family ATPase [Spirochaetota bacterium]